MKPKVIRVMTISGSLRLIEGQYEYLSNNGYEVIAVSSNGPEQQQLEVDEGVKTYPVEMTRTISPFKDIKSVWKLFKILKKEKPLIIHTHTPKAGIVGMIAGKLAGVPNRFHTVAGLPLLVHKGFKRTLLNFVEKKTYSYATMVYPNSIGLRDIIVKNGYANSKKLVVIGKGSSNGVDINHFDPSLFSEEKKKTLKKALGIESSDFVYLFVGRIVRDKGINELVSAFKNINKKNINTKLLLVGSFERELDPIDRATDNIINENKNIITVGFQHDVRPYFAISDVFTFPSYREGFPNVLMQACAMSVASIVTDINGCNELITDNLNGLIVPVKNEHILMNKMLLLYSDSNLRNKLSSLSRIKIIQNYDRKKLWEQILTEYNSKTK